MAMVVVHLFQLAKIKNDGRQLVPVALRAIQFLIAVFVEKAPIVESCQRVGYCVDLEFLEIVVLDENGHAYGGEVTAALALGISPDGNAGNNRTGHAPHDVKKGIVGGNNSNFLAVVTAFAADELEQAFEIAW